MATQTYSTPEEEPPKNTGGFHVSQEPVCGAVAEGDAHKFDLGEEPAPPAPEAARPAYEDLGQLPASYSEDRLFLAARDPRWLFSYWDFDWSRYAADGMLGGVLQFFLRTSTAEGEDEAVFEIQPAARNWYVPVVKSGTTYFADLGFFQRDGAWHSIVRSGPATTPPENLAAEEHADFATLPAHLSYEQLLAMLRGQMEDGESLVSALARLAGEGRTALHPGQPPTWTAEQKRLLAALLGEALTDRVGLGSADFDQLLRKSLAEKLPGEIAGGLPTSLTGLLAPGPHSLFSGFGASWSAQPFSAKRGREFFLHVNTEIIFYGGTDPDATVWIDGQEIRLSPDGTFRYHFTLADGDFAIPIIARSPDGVEERTATLTFTRGTARTGEVGSTAQPAALSPLIGKK